MRRYCLDLCRQTKGSMMSVHHALMFLFLAMSLATISGETHLTFSPLLPTIPHLKSGKLKVIVVISARRSTAPRSRNVHNFG